MFEHTSVYQENGIKVEIWRNDAHVTYVLTDGDGCVIDLEDQTAEHDAIIKRALAL